MARETFYDEIEIEDFVWDAKASVYHYPCPCGDRFEITKSQLRDGDEVARCPSCSLIIRVIYEWVSLWFETCGPIVKWTLNYGWLQDDYEDYDSAEEEGAEDGKKQEEDFNSEEGDLEKEIAKLNVKDTVEEVKGIERDEQARAAATAWYTFFSGVGRGSSRPLWNATRFSLKSSPT
jgi:diphthamide biosynthesis protein 3